MGTDIHPYFETRDENGIWHLTFPSRPSDYWSEELVDQKVDDGSAITVFGPPTEAEISAMRAERNLLVKVDTDEDIVEMILYQKMEAYFKSLSDEEIMERYAHDPKFNREFYPKEVQNRYGSTDVRSRDYNWFSALSGLRGGSTAHALVKEGTPKDSCNEITNEVKRWEGDGHSHGSIMCDAMLADKRLSGYPAAQWVSKHICDPANTRMVFFYDN